MHWRAIIKNTPGRLKKWVFIAGAGFALFWFLFLDTHSLLSRIQWHREYVQLEMANEQLREQIADLEARLARPLTDLEIERIAREQYGMTRPGDVVNPNEVENRKR